ncbi:unnamed protein product, partial [Tetraodon nigroviridis]
MGLSQVSHIPPDLRSASGHPNVSRPTCSIDESYKYVFLPVCYSLTFLFSLTLNSVVLLRSCRHQDRCCAAEVAAGGAGTPRSSIWYLGICHPMRTITLESKRVVKGTCALVWAVVFILTCPIFRFAQTGYVRRGGGQAGASGEDWNHTHVEDQDRYVNCWDDAIDKEFADYVPYGIVLHLLGFFVPFVIIAWCYSQVVRTIFQTLRSPPSSIEGGEDGPVGDGGIEGGVERERTSVSISGSQYSYYIRRRRKSIKTIVTITLLFALCFLPFHVTRTLFLLMRRGQLGGCSVMKTVSICYKVTRPLASCNAWLNALLYFLTGDK